MVHCLKERNCGPYNSHKNKIFDAPIPFADKILLFYPLNCLSELLRNPEINSVLSLVYVFATMGISGEE